LAGSHALHPGTLVGFPLAEYDQKGKARPARWRERRLLVEQALTVNLPSEIKIALADASQQDGVSQEEFVEKAIRQHLFLRRFRLLRDRMAARMQQQGVVTDQDVFDRVS
jgi:hypothetical protein